jgi:hypothetical protein
MPRKNDPLIIHILVQQGEDYSSSKKCSDALLKARGVPELELSALRQLNLYQKRLLNKVQEALSILNNGEVLTDDAPSDHLADDPEPAAPPAL